MRIFLLALGVILPLGSANVFAHEMQSHEGAVNTPFQAAMAEAMARMDAGMAAAKPSGDPDRDFLSMMIPHHQGAIDMAKAVLLASKDPKVRNLAEGIIAEQQVEIQRMRSILAALQGTHDKTGNVSKEQVQ